MIWACLTIVFTIVMFNVLVAVVCDINSNLEENSIKYDNTIKLNMVIEVCQFRRTFSTGIYRYFCCRKSDEVGKRRNSSYEQSYLIYEKKEEVKNMQEQENEAIEDARQSLDKLIKIRNQNEEILLSEDELGGKLRENQQKIENLLLNYTNKEI